MAKLVNRQKTGMSFILPSYGGAPVFRCWVLDAGQFKSAATKRRNPNFRRLETAGNHTADSTGITGGLWAIRPEPEPENPQAVRSPAKHWPRCVDGRTPDAPRAAPRGQFAARPLLPGDTFCRRSRGDLWRKLHSYLVLQSGHQRHSHQRSAA